MACLASFSAQLRSQPIPVDPVEWQVNTYTPGIQRIPRVAVHADGGFVVAWSSDGSAGTDSSGESIQIRRFRTGGAPVDAEDVQANSYTLSHQQRPDVAPLGDAGFVVVWDSAGSWGNDDQLQSVQLLRFGPDGVALDLRERQVNLYPFGSQSAPSVAPIGEDRFVVAWESDGSFGSDQDGRSIQARRFRGDGTPIDATEFQVNTVTALNQRAPDVASAPDGSFVVLWQSSAGDGSYQGIRGRRFAADGTPLDAAEFSVNSYTTGDQYRPAVAVDSNGGFVAVWESTDSSGTDQDLTSVQARRFASDGTPIDAADFQVNVITIESQWWPRVASNAEGDFVVAWTSQLPAMPGDFSAVARRFRRDGTAVDAVEFSLEASPAGEQEIPDVARNLDGDIFATWLSEFSSGSDPLASIQLRRFGRPSITVAPVTSPEGGPGCQLGDAIRAANTSLPVGECPAGNEGAVIELSPGSELPISVPEAGPNALPPIERPVTVRGHGSTIARDLGLACPSGPYFRLFEIVEGGVLALEDSILTNGCLVSEPGGAVLVNGGTLILSRSTIEGNQTGGSGGGVAVEGGKFLSSDSTIRANQAGGMGGGLSVAGFPGWIRIDRSTLSENLASSGGGFADTGATEGLIRNSTLSGNETTSSGGGLYLDTPGSGLRLEFSTVADNEASLGSGAYLQGGLLSLHGTLIGDGSLGSDCAGAAGSAGATGLNLDTDGTCAALANGGIATVGAGFQLGGLGDNGGSTPTHSPLGGSPTIDTAPACETRFGAPVRRDQRGYPRPTDDDSDSESECELGSVERGPIFLDGFASGGTTLWSSTAP